MLLLVASIPDEEDLWVRFVVLFSLVVIDQWRTHLPRSIRWRLTGVKREHTRGPSLVDVPWSTTRLLKGAEHRSERAWSSWLPPSLTGSQNQRHETEVGRITRV